MKIFAFAILLTLLSDYSPLLRACAGSFQCDPGAPS